MVATIMNNMESILKYKGPVPEITEESIKSMRKFLEACTYNEVTGD